MADSTRPTIIEGGMDPATLSLVADFERISPPVLGINEDFMMEMCRFAGGEPLGTVDEYLGDYISESFNEKIIFNTRDQSSQDEIPVTLSGPWSSFMNSYAIWDSARSRTFERNYTINLDKKSELLLRYQVDDQMWVTIDGKQIVEFVGFRPTTQIGATKVLLEAGSHTLNLKAWNRRGPSGVALLVHLIRELTEKEKIIPQIISPPTSRYVVRNETVYIRKIAPDCGPDEDRTEDIEIGSIETLAGNAVNNLITDSYRYYGRPILPGSRCAGSVDANDTFWWDTDPREESFPNPVYYDTNGKPQSLTDDPYGPDPFPINDPPPITDRGCD